MKELIIDLEKILKGVKPKPLPITEITPVFSDDLQTIWSQYITTVSSEEKEEQHSSNETLVLHNESEDNVVLLLFPPKKLQHQRRMKMMIS